MQEEFKEKLKLLLKEYDAHIWGRDSGISYEENTESLSIEGLLIEVNDSN